VKNIENWGKTDGRRNLFVCADGGAGAGDAGSRNRSPGAEPEAVSHFNPFCLLR